MDKIFTQLSNPGYAFMVVGDAYHAFGSLYFYVANLIKLPNKVMEQH